MKNKRSKLITAGITLCFSLLFLGCRKEEYVFEKQELFKEQESELTEEELLEETLEEKADVSLEKEKSQEKEKIMIAVHICGAVVTPGVYEIEQGMRLYQLVERAGGFEETAEQEYLNLAAVLEDGMQVVVPTKDEVKEIMEERKRESLVASSKNQEQEIENGKIDINTADEKELCTLPGIGEGRAKAIIEYRTENGLFKALEDIMKVPGIKEAAYGKIKDLIMVSK